MLSQYSCPIIQTGYSQESEYAFQKVANHFFDSSLHKECN